MSDVIIPYRFLILGNDAATLAADPGIPKERELVIETDTGRAKLGDGSTGYPSLKYVTLGAVDFTGLSDGKVPTWDAASSTFKMVASSGAAGAMTLVGTATVAGSAATTLTLSSLDLATDGRWFIEMNFQNATASVAVLSIFFNADTTATNYDTQNAQSNATTYGAARQNAATVGVLDASKAAVGSAIIQSDRTGRASVDWRMRIGSTTTINTRWGVTMWRTVGNVTSITISSSVANALSIGDYFKVWKIT